MHIVHRIGLFVALAFVPLSLAAQSIDPSQYAELKWRTSARFAAAAPSAPPASRSSPTSSTSASNNGGVWKTTDYGLTWTPIFDDQPTQSIGAVAVAPSDPNIVYVGQRRRAAAPGSLGRRRHLQVHRCRQDVGAPGAARGAADRRDHHRSAAIRIACSSRRSATRTGRTPSAASSARPTADARWQKVLYKDENTGAIDLAFDPAQCRRRCTRRCGPRARARGNTTTRTPARPAASSNRSTAARRGSR